MTSIFSILSRFGLDIHNGYYVSHEDTARETKYCSNRSIIFLYEIIITLHLMNALSSTKSCQRVRRLAKHTLSSGIKYTPPFQLKLAFMLSSSFVSNNKNY